MEEIIRSNASSLFFTPYRTNDRGACTACDGDLCWGCRANAFYFAASAYTEDPLCSHSHLDGDHCPY